MPSNTAVQLRGDGPTSGTKLGWEVVTSTVPAEDGTWTVLKDHSRVRLAQWALWTAGSGVVRLRRHTAREQCRVATGPRRSAGSGGRSSPGGVAGGGAQGGSLPVGRGSRTNAQCARDNPGARRGLSCPPTPTLESPLQVRSTTPGGGTTVRAGGRPGADRRRIVESGHLRTLASPTTGFLRGLARGVIT